MAARLVARVTLPRQFRSAGVGRRFVTNNLHDWLGERECVGDAEVIVSEMIGNAVQHGRGKSVLLTLSISLDRDVIAIELGEQSPELAEAPSLPSADDEGGRGLFIVDALAATWGMRPTADGKVVWATLDVGTAHIGLDVHEPLTPDLPLVPLRS